MSNLGYSCQVNRYHIDSLISGLERTADVRQTLAQVWPSPKLSFLQRIHLLPFAELLPQKQEIAVVALGLTSC